MRTDQQIVDETNELARLCLSYIGTGYEAPDDTKFYETTNPRGQQAWAMACKIMELVTKTEVADALSAIQVKKKSYRVTLVEKVQYFVDVTAENADQAGELACELWARSCDPNLEFKWQGQGVTVHNYEEGE